MCLLLASRGHPDYELVLVSNRDEFFGREAHITSWQDDGYILCPYDVPQSVDSHKFATWCGINKDGRVSTILNLKLEHHLQHDHIAQLISRGEIPTEFLSRRKMEWNQWDSYTKFAKQFNDLSNTRDFNLFYGDCKIGQYRVIDSLDQTHDVLTSTELENDNSYIVLSNDIYRQKSEEKWAKVQRAERYLHRLIQENVHEDQDAFISKCFQVASVDASPELGWPPNEVVKNTNITTQSIFVPPMTVSPELDLGTSTHVGFYGTRSQIVLLVSKDRQRVKWVERVIHNSDSLSLVVRRSPNHPAEQVSFEFSLN